MEERQRELDLYQEALRLERPWYVKSRAFDAQENRLDIYIEVDTHSTFTCCSGIKGKHLRGYLSEYTYRCSRRRFQRERFNLLLQSSISAKLVTAAELRG